MKTDLRMLQMLIESTEGATTNEVALNRAGRRILVRLMSSAEHEANWRKDNVSARIAVKLGELFPHLINSGEGLN